MYHAPFDAPAHSGGFGLGWGWLVGGLPEAAKNRFAEIGGTCDRLPHVRVSPTSS